MPVKMQPTSVIKTNLGIEPNGKVQKFFTNTCYRYMDKYVPKDTGTLRETVTIDSDRITYEQEYARIVLSPWSCILPRKPQRFHLSDLP